MASYGYMIHQFQAHRVGKADEPLRLGTLRSPEEAGDDGTDLLTLLYGIMHGLVGNPITSSDANRHLEVTGIEPIGRCVKFEMKLGRSGQESTITDPVGGGDFRRTRQHVENVPRRGVLVAPDHSTGGLLVLEAHGRTTGRQLLCDELKRSVRATLDPPIVVDFNSVVDSKALAEYLEKAKINHVRMRRYKLPKDLADQLEMEHEESDAGALDMRVRGRFKQHALKKLQASSDARRRMLVVDGLQFDEATVQVEVDGRRMSIAVTSENAPRFIHVIGSERPTDDAFYAEVFRGVASMASGVGVKLADQWRTKPWSQESKAYVVRRSE